MCLLNVTCKCSLVERTISGGRLVTDLQFTVYQVKNCLTVQPISIKCHLHQRTNDCTYPRIIQPIPSAEQQHSVGKMQCRTREGSSQKLQKVHAL